ncbi:MAG: type II toxin-antitoxin system prevent-host-death family antitoxin [Bryobacteraceae bacterium]
MQVNMHRAKTELSKLVAAAERGEEVIISRNGKPAVQLLPVRRRKVRFGALKGEVKVPKGDKWWQPMTDEEVDRFLGVEPD